MSRSLLRFAPRIKCEPTQAATQRTAQRALTVAAAAAAVAALEQAPLLYPGLGMHLRKVVKLAVQLCGWWWAPL